MTETPNGARVSRSLGREMYESPSRGWLRLVRDTHTHSVRGYVCDLLVVDVAAHAKAARLMERDLMGLVVGGAEAWVPTPAPTLAERFAKALECDVEPIPDSTAFCSEPFNCSTHETDNATSTCWVPARAAGAVAEWLESTEVRGAVERAVLGRATIAAAKAAVAALAAEARKGATQ